MMIWFLPIALVPIQPAPLRLATPAIAAVEVRAITEAHNAARVGRDRRVRGVRTVRYRTPMEFRAHQFKYLSAAPAAACNGSVCAIPVMQSLADNPRVEP
jgi:hypothetical protein